MKVILVSPYSEQAVGGIINWTKYIVNYHRDHRRGVDMHLLYNENAEQVIGGANTLKRLMKGVNNYIPVCRDFKKAITEEHYDVVHICSSASFGLIRDLIVVKAAQKKGVKTLVHLHFGRIPQILKSKGWEKFLLLRLFKRVNRIVVMDRASYNALKEEGFRTMVYLPNPLSSDVMQLIEKYGDMKREPRTIVYAGHVNANKGVFELVKACSQLSRVELSVLGRYSTPDIADRLFDTAGSNSKEWLSIPGNKPFEEVIKAMMTCSVFVLPSYSEGFPNVILESMACGAPIVATSVGAIPEMLAIDSDKQCGLCVPVKDISALKDAISYLINDSGRAAELGRNARERVYEQYSMPKIWEQLVELWRDLVNF